VLSESDYFNTKKETIEFIDIPPHQIQNWKNALKRVLPDYMIPSQYLLLNRLPTTINGKIDRNNLPEPTLETSPDEQDEFTAPRNDTEQLIHDIWSQQLSLESISVSSSFFELGGHSLIAVRGMLSLEKGTGVRIPISALFESPTTEKLAQQLNGEKKKPKWESLVPIKPAGSKKPFYIVHGLGLNVLTFEPLRTFMD